MTEHCCKTCKYHYHENISDGYVCVNNKSAHLADWTGDNDACELWESKE